MGSGFFLLCLVIFLLALVTEDITFLITSVQKKTYSILSARTLTLNIVNSTLLFMLIYLAFYIFLVLSAGVITASLLFYYV